VSGLTLLCQGHPDVPEINLSKIAEFLGLKPNIVSIFASSSAGPDGIRNLPGKTDVLITTADTLLCLIGGHSDDAAWSTLRSQLPAHLLVYGFEDSSAHAALLRSVSGQTLSDVQSVQTAGARVSVARDTQKAWRQLSGVAFETALPGLQSVFRSSDIAALAEPIVSIAQMPLFACAAGDPQTFLLAGENFPDLDQEVPRGVSVLEYFCGVAPVMMFLRVACPDAVWHNDLPSACFIVDDPPLKKRYGFLDFQKLVEAMQAARFSTSIAFIPWNFDRTEKRVAETFKAHSEQLSLCVHGCDHLRGEFGAHDANLLQEKAARALERMARHFESSGVGFDDVMVFPQGIFSTAALRALKDCHYLAAVNTSPYPVDAQNLSLRDLLDVAITRFSDFPLFTRRYPKNLPELAFDLFLGKPAFLVEHHGFFREGYQSLTDTIRELYRIEPNLRWTNLAAICSQSSLKKAGPEGIVEVRFFTDRFSLRNEADRPQRYSLIRGPMFSPQQKSVTVNGRVADFVTDAGGIRVKISLDPGETANVSLDFDKKAAPIRPATDHLHEAKVFVRRSLSEFRDNYLDRSALLSKSARKRGAAKKPVSSARP